eukprot:7536338-Pyramimonas_sp.AAC.1
MRRCHGRRGHPLSIPHPGSAPAHVDHDGVGGATATADRQNWDARVPEPQRADPGPAEAPQGARRQDASHRS